MKRVATFAAIALLAASSGAFAASEVKGSNITNLSNVNQSANLAVMGSEANMGSIKIKDSKVQDSNVTNLSNVNQSANLAVMGSEANMGSIKIE